MTNYEYLLWLHEKNVFEKDIYITRLKRLIMGYHATQFFFRNLITPNTRVADAGCYFGQWSYPLLEMAKEVSFIDYVDERFPYLEKLVEVAPNANLIVHNFSESPLKQKSSKFDVIICMGTLCCLKAESLENFCGNMLSALNEGGILLVDKRIGHKLHAWNEFILRKNAFILTLYPSLSKDLEIVPPSFLEKLNAVNRYFKYLARYFGRICLEKLGNSGRHFDQNIDRLVSIFISNGLHEMSLEPVVNIKEEYEILRDIEGFNLRNTFVGNYFWVALYKKQAL